ncbi:unnamed protein product [Thelazia callipaeda]|uniref:G_PROTEIN_RECEP_F1_2 domain-containing protein n=1 Tax=Thelazia callipaeda TaxID=103827 RepID=A0A0N5CLA3_THECL|nr:unnamed protein product [Thelazia callipaeda]
MDNETWLLNELECQERPALFLKFKMIFVGIIGTLSALIGFLENILVFYTFISSRVLRHKNLLHLTCLSVCDIFICFSYIEIMSVQVFAEYFRYFPLLQLWHSYLKVAFATSHIAICSASFLIMAAAFERYLQIGTTLKLFIQLIFQFFCRHRGKIVIAAFLLAVLFRGSVYFEIQIYHLENCEGFASIGVRVSELAQNVYYDGIWRFLIRRIATVFLPFFVLSYCNAAIVVSLRRNNRKNTIKMLVILFLSATSSKLRDRVKVATRSLMMVVTCYLCSNIIDVFISAWEYLDSASLMQLEEFYSTATDVSSLLTTLAACLRLPIYLINDKVIRKEVMFI